MPIIVKTAHKEGLRVTTHVETATDFHNAVEAGVDEIAHVPGYYVAKGENISDFAISEADAKLAAKKQIFVTTTTVSSTRTFAKDPQQLAKIQANQKLNLQLLKRSGVKLAIGSDAYWTTSLSEAMNLYELKVFDNLTLLKLWCESTAEDIFPGRKIGYLKPGFEASFLALDGNPLEDFTNVKRISFRMKQGTVINLP